MTPETLKESEEELEKQKQAAIEVLEEVKNAEKISFFFTIRNKNYKYVIK